MHAPREKEEVEAAEGTRGRRSLIYRFCCRPPSTFQAARVRSRARARAICCATLRSNFEFHRRIMNRYANPRIGIITHSCDIVFSHAVNRRQWLGEGHDVAGRRDATRQQTDVADKSTEDQPRQLPAHTHTRATRSGAPILFGARGERKVKLT